VTAANSPAAGPRLRVLQLNVYGLTAPWPERRDILRRGLQSLDVDLVSLVETVVTDEQDQARDLLGPEYQIWHQRDRAADGTGLSLASRLPMTKVRELDLAGIGRPARFPVATLIAQVQAPAGIGAVLFVGYTSAWQRDYEYEREMQALTTASELEKLAAGGDRHVIVAGDFNASPESASVRFWTGLQSLDQVSVMYRDAWAAVHGPAEGHSFDPRNELVRTGDTPLELGRRLDYVMVRAADRDPTLQVVSCALVFDEPVRGVWPSDHFGVLAELAAHPRSR
jgi:endonuclease/exonuclease/phosphatase family metal-dependent hydrolase